MFGDEEIDAVELIGIIRYGKYIYIGDNSLKWKAMEFYSSREKWAFKRMIWSN